MGFFSKPKPPEPPRPPKVVQYPNVLAPPQDGGLESIESYQYSEVVELLSDGPIEGLVNKNGIKVDGVNLFEGVYFNNTPVKETSDLNYDCFELLSNHISSKLSDAWSKEIGSSYQFASSALSNYSIADLCIKTYLEEASLNFLGKQKQKDWLSSEISDSYKLFLTEICTSYICVLINNKNIDASSANLINLNLYNVSEQLYPSICSDLFGSYSYFEMPQSTVSYGTISLEKIDSAGTTIKIVGSQDSNNYIVFKIWSVAKNLYNKIMPIYDFEILKKYFNFYAFQNKKSLYNFNSVQIEFKNGSQYQDPINSIQNVEMDIKISKQLVGPFKKDGISRRLLSFKGDSNRPPLTNIRLEDEGSSDLRYVRSWPVEYDINNNPYIICCLCMSYSEYDATTRGIKDQDAYPYTHYIANQNAECIYITIGLNQLFDVTHVDLSSKELSMNTTKYKNTFLVPAGTERYCDLDFCKDTSSRASYFKKNVNPGTAGSPGKMGDNLEPVGFDFSNACQHITAGTKLPSVVSFKIETGYETDSDGGKTASSNNYFSYRYDIFGLSSSPNTTLDFGRKNNYSNTVYTYKSSTEFSESLAHLGPYEAYDLSLFEDEYNQTNSEEWGGAVILNKITTDNFNYYDAITNEFFTKDIRQALLNRLNNAQPVSVFTAKDKSLDVGESVYLDDQLKNGVGNAVIVFLVLDKAYVYEVSNSKITRVTLIDARLLVPTDPVTTNRPFFIESYFLFRYDQQHSFVWPYIEPTSKMYVKKRSTSDDFLVREDIKQFDSYVEGKLKDQYFFQGPLPPDYTFIPFPKPLREYFMESNPKKAHIGPPPNDPIFIYHLGAPTYFLRNYDGVEGLYLYTSAFKDSLGQSNPYGYNGEFYVVSEFLAFGPTIKRIADPDFQTFQGIKYFLYKPLLRFKYTKKISFVTDYQSNKNSVGFIGDADWDFFTPLGFALDQVKIVIPTSYYPASLRADFNTDPFARVMNDGRVILYDSGERIAYEGAVKIKVNGTYEF